MGKVSEAKLDEGQGHHWLAHKANQSITDPGITKITNVESRDKYAATRALLELTLPIGKDLESSLASY